MPPEVVVRLLETEVDEDPAPEEDEDDVLDPAVALTRDPTPALLEASAEHTLLGAATAVPNEESAPIATVAISVATSAPRFVLTHTYMGTPLFRRHRNFSPQSTKVHPDGLHAADRAH
jgi:hypothetical protein